MTSKRSFQGLTAAIFGLCAIGLPGCDAGREPFAKAAQAEEKGEYVTAASLYEEVCTAKSPLCDAAKKRQTRLVLKRAWKAFDEGKYADVKAALDAAGSSGDSVVSSEAAAILALPEVVQGAAYESALVTSDKTVVMAAMESIVKEPTALAPKAKEWLDKNRPAVLLAQVKAACVEGGKGSCVALVKKLGAAHPDSPEAKEAAALAAENYKRLHPRLKEMENLLIQRAMVFDKEKKIALCMNQENSEENCQYTYATKIQTPTLSYLETFWTNKLVGVDDPFHHDQFEKRWERAAAGEYDPEPWPKP